jgi:hypothetical protein
MVRLHELFSETLDSNFVYKCTPKDGYLSCVIESEAGDDDVNVVTGGDGEVDGGGSGVDVTNNGGTGVASGTVIDDEMDDTSESGGKSKSKSSSDKKGYKAETKFGGFLLEVMGDIFGPMQSNFEVAMRRSQTFSVFFFVLLIIVLFFWIKCSWK